MTLKSQFTKVISWWLITLCWMVVTSAALLAVRSYVESRFTLNIHVQMFVVCLLLLSVSFIIAVFHTIRVIIRLFQNRHTETKSSHDIT